MALIRILRRLGKALTVIVALATLALLIASCGNSNQSQSSSASQAALQGHVLDPPLQKPEFLLTDTAGRPFDFKAATEGSVTLLYFGYTHCPDVCPSHMADLSSALKRNPDLQGHVKVVFVTVDPKRDTPERMNTWLGLFNPEFIGLRGSDSEVQAAADEALGRLSFPIETAAFGTGQYSVSHAAIVLAYGHDGVARVAWPFGTKQSVYENDLRILIEHGETAQ